MKNIESIFEKLFDHYQVGTMSSLSIEINVPQTTISKWKQRNSINAIKKKCRELGIYKEIFEDDVNEEIPVVSIQISKEDINCKLFLFKRRSLVYLYYLLQKKDINNAIDYFNWQIKKDEENKFVSFVSDFHLDLENNHISFSGFRSETDSYISHFIKVDELDYIFQNKDVFLKSIIFMTNQKKT
jgi:hypothetical protein